MTEDVIINILGEADELQSAPSTCLVSGGNSTTSESPGPRHNTSLIIQD